MQKVAGCNKSNTHGRKSALIFSAQVLQAIIIDAFVSVYISIIDAFTFFCLGYFLFLFHLQEPVNKLSEVR